MRHSPGDVEPTLWINEETSLFEYGIPPKAKKKRIIMTSHDMTDAELFEKVVEAALSRPVLVTQEKRKRIVMTPKHELKDSGGRTSFESGAVRDSSEGKANMHWLPPFFWERYGQVGKRIKLFLQEGEVAHLKIALKSMISSYGLKRLCDHLEAGASKYAAFNWAKGMPVSRCLDSLGRHLESLRKGEEDEDHAAAAMCNLAFMVHYCEIGLNDMPAYDRLAPSVASVPEMVSIGANEPYIAYIHPDEEGEDNEKEEPFS